MSDPITLPTSLVLESALSPRDIETVQRYIFAAEALRAERDAALRKVDQLQAAGMGVARNHAECEARVATLEAALREIAVWTHARARAALGDQEGTDQHTAVFIGH